MASDYIPAQDGAFQAWLLNFSTLITADPTAYGLDAADAVAIDAASDDFTAALTAATDPGTRTPTTVAAKDNSRQSAESLVRPYAMQINANTAVTDAQRTSLGLTVRSTTPTPPSVPTDVPTLAVRSQVQETVNIDIRSSATPDSRARPAGTDGAQLVMEERSAAEPYTYSFSDSVNIQDNPAQLTLPGGSAGTVYRMRCRWFNRAKANGVGSPGPWSAYVSIVSTAI